MKIALSSALSVLASMLPLILLLAGAACGSSSHAAVMSSDSDGGGAPISGTMMPPSVNNDASVRGSSQTVMATGLFLLGPTPNAIYRGSIATDQTGGMHWFSRLRYGHCASQCNNVNNWSFVTLPPAAGGNNEFHGAVDSAGHPRILQPEATLSGGWDQYLECNANCTDAASWSAVKLDVASPLGESSNLVIDAQGGVAYALYGLGHQPGGYPYYVRCTSMCTDKLNWEVAILPPAFSQAKSLSLALTSSGQPRLAYNKGGLPAYGACDSECLSAAGWLSVNLSVAGDPTFLSLALDAQGRPRLGLASAYAWCDSNCTTAQSWQSYRLGSEAHQLVLDSQGNPRTAGYTGTGIQYRSCAVGCNSMQASWQDEFLPNSDMDSADPRRCGLWTLAGAPRGSISLALDALDHGVVSLDGEDDDPLKGGATGFIDSECAAGEFLWMNIPTAMGAGSGGASGGGMTSGGAMSSFDGTTGKACTSDADCAGPNGPGANRCSNGSTYTVDALVAEGWATPVCVVPYKSPGNCDPAPPTDPMGTTVHWCDGPDVASSPGICIPNDPNKPSSGQGICFPKCTFATDGTAAQGCVGHNACSPYDFVLDTTTNTVLGFGSCQSGCQTDADCANLGAGYGCQTDIGFCIKGSPVPPPTGQFGDACSNVDDAGVSLREPNCNKCNFGFCDGCAAGPGGSGFCSSVCVTGGAACPNGWTCDVGEPSVMDFNQGTTQVLIKAQGAGLLGTCFPPCAGGLSCPAGSICKTNTPAGANCEPQ